MKVEKRTLPPALRLIPVQLALPEAHRRTLALVTIDADGQVRIVDADVSDLEYRHCEPDAFMQEFLEPMACALRQR